MPGGSQTVSVAPGARQVRAAWAGGARRGRARSSAAAARSGSAGRPGRAAAGAGGAGQGRPAREAWGTPGSCGGGRRVRSEGRPAWWARSERPRPRSPGGGGREAGQVAVFVWSCSIAAAEVPRPARPLSGLRRVGGPGPSAAPRAPRAEARPCRGPDPELELSRCSLPLGLGWHKVLALRARHGRVSVR